MLPQHCWLKAVQFAHATTTIISTTTITLVAEKRFWQQVYEKRPKPGEKNLMSDFTMFLF